MSTVKYLSHLLLLLGLAVPASGYGTERLRLATTTSTENSGLLALLHPPFEAKYQLKVDVIAVGTGKALRLGENGDVDLVLVHAPEAEQVFVAAGFGIERLPVMHNDFVLLGPATDPVSVGGAANVTEAVARIAAGDSAFISRGDDSGTHQKELELWTTAGIVPRGEWYLAAGQGMGAVLKITDDKQGYTLADRGTYLALREKLSLVILSEGDPALFNPYHVILVNPARHPHVRSELARRYVEFIRGEEGQRIIREFMIAGETLFYPDVIK